MSEFHMHTVYSKACPWALALGLAVVFALPAQAVPLTTGDIEVIQGNPQPTEPKIYLDLATNQLSSTGHVGSQTGDPGTPVVSFLSNIVTDWANGFSTINAHDNHAVINTLTVSVPTGWTFSDLEFSTLKGNSVLFTAKLGAATVGTYSNDAVGTGLEAWLLETIHSTVMDSLVIFSSDGFDQLKQFSISGLCSVDGVCATTTGGGGQGETPLPAALPLFASGTGLLGFLTWRRKKKLMARA